MASRLLVPRSALVLLLALLLPLTIAASSGGAGTKLAGNGIVRVKSAYGFDETVARLKNDIADKGIMFFMAVDQAKLGAGAGTKLAPSTLLIFGNPPLGIQFLTSNPDAGLDWPVRLLVNQDSKGQVWAVYTDFDWIKRRHAISDRDEAFKMAASVIGSITSSVAAK